MVTSAAATLEPSAAASSSLGLLGSQALCRTANFQKCLPYAEADVTVWFAVSEWGGVGAFVTPPAQNVSCLGGRSERSLACLR